MTGLENTTLYNEDMKGITTDNSSFELFRKYDALYVDKTEFICRLLSVWPKRFFFISRPRRFGKSLFCDTLRNVFEGNKELFRGLYIYDKYDFEPYPVLSFNFAGQSISSIERFTERIAWNIKRYGKAYGVDMVGDDPAFLLEQLLIGIAENTGKKAVIIIDEYDSPITTAIIEKKPFVDEIRSILNSFYSTIKNSNQYIHFFFMTGVVKLSNLSIFSAMNNLVDLSMKEEFAGAFGYTDEELDEYFGEGIDEYLEANPGKYKSREEFREKIRSYYDGYRFSPESETRVYNPVSIGFFFNDGCKFDNYWIQTGATSFAVALARNVDLSKILSSQELKTTAAAFSTFDISDIREKNLTERKMIAMLYYTGYLSIESYDEPYIHLSFPNAEVAASFVNHLLEQYSSDRNMEFDGWAKEFYDACKDGNEENLVRKLTEYFDAFSYELIGDEKEKFYHAIFHAIFFLTGIYSITEDRGLRGRADEVIITSDSLWIFELKVDASAEDALRQIEDKGYADKYADMIERRNLKVHKVGISLSSKTRSIAEWKCI